MGQRARNTFIFYYMAGNPGSENIECSIVSIVGSQGRYEEAKGTVLHLYRSCPKAKCWSLISFFPFRVKIHINFPLLKQDE